MRNNTLLIVLHLMHARMLEKKIINKKYIFISKITYLFI